MLTLTGAIAASQAGAEPTAPVGFWQCAGPGCASNPDPYPDPAPATSPAGNDDAINIFVGGDYLVREQAAEAEGRVVVLGNFDQDKDAAGTLTYNLGAVGVGSQITPSNGAVALAVGGSITVASGETLALDGHPGTPLTVEHGGAVSGTVSASSVTANPAAVAAYANTVAELQAVSACAAQQTVTGTVTTVPFPTRTVFTGDGTSPVQVFTLNADILPDSGTDQGIEFLGIPAGATVIVNVTGAAREIHTNSGGGNAPTVDALRDRLLWNFVDATSVTLEGSAQFQGSVLIPNTASSTTVRYPGMNGRFYTAGDLLHGGTSGGTEFHSYPFTGTFPDCAPADYDLALAKVASTGPFAEGDTVTWTVRVQNQGAVASGDYTVTDQLPSGTAATAISNGGALASGAVTWNLTGLAPGTFVELTFQTVIPSGFVGEMRNWAEISADSGNDDDSTPDTNTGAGNGPTTVDDVAPNDLWVPIDDLTVIGTDGQPAADEDDNDDAVVTVVALVEPTTTTSTTTTTTSTSAPTTSTTVTSTTGAASTTTQPGVGPVAPTSSIAGPGEPGLPITGGSSGLLPIALALLGIGTALWGAVRMRRT